MIEMHFCMEINCFGHRLREVYRRELNEQWNEEEEVLEE